MNDRAPHNAFARLARWWATTTQAQRFEAVKASIRGDSEAPPLKTLHLAIIAAELATIRQARAHGEGQRGGEAAHGAAAKDAEVIRVDDYRGRRELTCLVCKTTFAHPVPISNSFRIAARAWLEKHGHEDDLAGKAPTPMQAATIR